MGYWVRTGRFGHVSVFGAASAERFPRGCRVICRTDRGLEVGHVLAERQDDAASDASSKPWVLRGQVLRRMTSDDELLWDRLERHRGEAWDACCQLLSDRQVPATLVDVELLFDGQSLFFYFLGEVNAQLDQLTRELADTYDANVRFRQFSDALTHGCGPDCGTELGGGCGDSTTCSSCALHAACRPPQAGTYGASAAALAPDQA